MQPVRSDAILRIVDGVAIILCQSYQLARARLASAASPVLRLMMERDQLVTESELLRRELAVMRDQRAGLHSSKRPDYAPEQRLAILQVMRLRGWNAKDTARRFVLHPNTVRSWIKVAEGRQTSSSLLGRLPWNKIDDAVRWAVHELRRLCPEPEFGTRTIACHPIRREQHLVVRGVTAMAGQQQFSPGHRG